MTDSTDALIGRPAWVELTTPDVAASGDFYHRLLGWQVDVSPDPQYGGYAVAKVGENDVAGIGPKQSPEAPTAWGLYIGSRDVDGLAERVAAAGGTVVAPPFDVGDQGRMAVFQVRRARSSRPGSLARCAASGPRHRARSAGRSSTRAGSTGPSRSTPTLRLVGEGERDRRRPGDVQRVPAGRPKRRGRLGDGPERPG